MEGCLGCMSPLSMHLCSILMLIWVLQIAGGLLAGGALVGAGVALKKSHDRKEGMEAWLEDARYRTQNFRSGQGNGPVGWVLCEGRQIPQDAIPGGKENSGTLFIGRGFHKGSVSKSSLIPCMYHVLSINFSSRKGFDLSEDWCCHWLCSRRDRCKCYWPAVWLWTPY